MSTETFMKDFISSIDAKWSEVDLLWSMLETYVDAPNNTYSVLYKSCVILTVATFEGLLKETVKCFVSDINNNYCFRNLSHNFKKFYVVKKFSTDINVTIQKITDTLNLLDNNAYKLDYSAFLVSNNKNPSPTIIGRYAENLGESSFFLKLYKSDIEDVVFSSSRTDIEVIYNEFRTYLLMNLNTYPYNLSDIYNLGLNFGEQKKVKPRKTMYEEFNDNFIKARNSVAHGVVMDEIKGKDELYIDILKIKILFLSFVYVVCKIQVIP